MDPSQLQPGTRLDRYELLCPLAYGGMASVWLARFGGRLGFERMVVIKMILPQYSQDPRFQEMFLDEARIASRIEHPNVARILDVGEQDESYFIVMEWVDGDSLSKIMRAAHAAGERLPWGVALRICADAAAGLHAAHELKDRDGAHLGVVHRDVSPQNILVANNGTTVIIDFGVAKARDRVSQDTSAGQLKGKIRYMAPEQALGRDIDHRADVWAIGAMLYEMLAGTPPFDGPNEVATLHLLTSGHRPTPLPAAMPAPLRAIVEQALTYDPQHRFPSARDMSLALESALAEIGLPTTAADVAVYTGRLLADRKASRHKAVEKAVAVANERGSLPSISRPIAPDAMAPSSDRFVPSYASRPSIVGLPPIPIPRNSDPASLAETPSAASNGTIGSAALDFVAPARETRPRYLGAAFLGVAVAAGLLGIVLAFGGALGHRDAAAPSSAPPEPVLVAAPVEAPTPAPLPTVITATEPSASASASAEPKVLVRKPVPNAKPRTGPTAAPPHPDRGF